MKNFLILVGLLLIFSCEKTEIDYTAHNKDIKSPANKDEVTVNIVFTKEYVQENHGQELKLIVSETAKPQHKIAQEYQTNSDAQIPDDVLSIAEIEVKATEMQYPISVHLVGKEQPQELSLQIFNNDLALHTQAVELDGNKEKEEIPTEPRYDMYGGLYCETRETQLAGSELNGGKLKVYTIPHKYESDEIDSLMKNYPASMDKSVYEGSTATIPYRGVPRMGGFYLPWLSTKYRYLVVWDDHKDPTWKNKLDSINDLPGETYPHQAIWMKAYQDTAMLLTIYR